MLIPFIELFKKYDIKPNGIIHCGASFVQESEMYEMLGIPKVIWVEAIPEVFHKAKEKLSRYNNQIIINACISDTDGEEVVFHISNNEMQSSSFLEFGTHEQEHPTVKFINDIKMTTTRLDTLFYFLERGDINDYDFLNSDLQGVELLAIKGLGKLINNFKWIYSEVNKQETYKNCALVDDMDVYLFGYGFERVETEWATPSWGDALYIKK